MSESGELYATVNYIKHKVDALEKIEMLHLCSNNALYDKYVSVLQDDTWLLQVYKTVDGVRSQKEIASIVSVSEKTVSNKIKILLEYGLIEIKDVGANGRRIYKHSVAEQAFKLTKI
jgi:biotin operon repressor